MRPNLYIAGQAFSLQPWEKANLLPLYTQSNNDIYLADWKGNSFLVLAPKDNTVKLPRLQKDMANIQTIEGLPIAVNTPNLTNYRKKVYLDNAIPFLGEEQFYLPFLGSYMQAKPKNIETNLKKFSIASQCYLLYFLYASKANIPIAKIGERLGYSPMTSSRVQKQLSVLSALQITREPQGNILRLRGNKKTLFLEAQSLLQNPVFKKAYILKKNLPLTACLAGESALAKQSMLQENNTLTYAVFKEAVDKNLLLEDFVDPGEQVELELWHYEPLAFAIEEGLPDPLSLVLSLQENTDERVQEALEELLEKTWEKLDATGNGIF